MPTVGAMCQMVGSPLTRGSDPTPGLPGPTTDPSGGTGTAMPPPIPVPDPVTLAFPTKTTSSTPQVQVVLIQVLK